MDGETPQLHKHNWFAISVLVGVCIVSLLYSGTTLWPVFFDQRSPLIEEYAGLYENQEYGADFLRGIELNRQAKFTEAIPYLEQALLSAQTPNEEAYAKLSLSSSYFAVDQEKAVSLLKEVATNEVYPPPRRSQAYILLAQKLSSNPSSQYVSYLFTGSDWESLIPKSLSRFDIRESIAKLMYISIDIYPDFFAYLWSSWRNSYASLYTIESKDEQIFYSQKSLKQFSDGNIILEDTASASRWDPGQIAYGRLIKAAVLGNLIELSQKGLVTVEQTQTDVVQAYEGTIAFADTHASYDYLAEEMSGMSRIYYMLYLVGTSSPEKVPSEKLVELSEEFVSLKSSMGSDRYAHVFKWLANVQVGFFKNSRYALAMVVNLNPRFKSDLINVFGGWKEADFSAILKP